MKIKKMYTAQIYPNQYVVKNMDGSYARFLITPFRKISKDDLTKINFYPDKGRNAEEAPDYLYDLYGLQKE